MEKKIGHCEATTHKTCGDESVVKRKCKVCAIRDTRSILMKPGFDVLAVDV